MARKLAIDWTNDNPIMCRSTNQNLVPISGKYNMYNKMAQCHNVTQSNCRIHHVTVFVTTIDLIINLGQDVLESVTTLFKLAAPSLSSCALSI